jgi:hypothetical protein
MSSPTLRHGVCFPGARQISFRAAISGPSCRILTVFVTGLGRKRGLVNGKQIRWKPLIKCRQQFCAKDSASLTLLLLSS